MLFETAANAYMQDKRKRLRRNTLEGYESTMKRHLMPRWNGIELESITPESIQEWVDSFDKAGAAEKAYKTLRQIIRWSIRRLGLRMFDPTAVGVELPRKAPYKPKVLDAKGAAEYLARAVGPRMRGRGDLRSDAGAQARRGMRAQMVGHRPAHRRGAHKALAPDCRRRRGYRASKNREKRAVMLASPVRREKAEANQGKRVAVRRRARQDSPTHRINLQAAQRAVDKHDEPSPHVGHACRGSRGRDRNRCNDARPHRHRHRVRALHRAETEDLPRRSKAGRTIVDARLTFRIPGMVERLCDVCTQ